MLLSFTIANRFVPPKSTSWFPLVLSFQNFSVSLKICSSPYLVVNDFCSMKFRDFCRTKCLLIESSVMYPWVPHPHSVLISMTKANMTSLTGPSWPSRQSTPLPCTTHHGRLFLTQYNGLMFLNG